MKNLLALFLIYSGVYLSTLPMELLAREQGYFLLFKVLERTFAILPLCGAILLGAFGLFNVVAKEEPGSMRGLKFLATLTLACTPIGLWAAVIDFTYSIDPPPPSSYLGPLPQDECQMLVAGVVLIALGAFATLPTRLFVRPSY